MALALTDPSKFVSLAIEEAKKRGFAIDEHTRHGRQIDFGHKKLHEQHLRALFPDILQPDANLSALIEDVAAGRPSTHRPMREMDGSRQSAPHHQL